MDGEVGQIGPRQNWDGAKHGVDLNHQQQICHKFVPDDLLKVVREVEGTQMEPDKDGALLARMVWQLYLQGTQMEPDKDVALLARMVWQVYLQGTQMEPDRWGFARKNGVATVLTGKPDGT